MIIFKSSLGFMKTIYFPRPSTVVIILLLHCAINTEHDLIHLLSNITIHEPHCDVSQPT